MKKILVGIPPKEHVLLALDEFNGLKKLGYSCSQVTYARNGWNMNIINRLYGVFYNAFNICRLLRQQKPDILYLNSRFNSLGNVRDYISITLFRLFSSDLKIILKSHGSEFIHLNKKSFFYNKWIVPALISKVDAWMFLSQEEKAEMLRNFPELEGRVHVTYNIIDAARSVSSVEFRKKHDISKDKFNFLFVGRMVVEKGVYTILESIANFKHKNECVFFMVGNGPELQGLKKHAKELDIEKNIRFTGFVNEVECDHFYANTNALIFPSFDEGFSMVLFKSVSCGLPIITTQIRAAKDQLCEPVNCLWVNGRSSGSVVKALSEIYKNTNLRSQMTINNKELGKKYTKEMVCKQMSGVFEKTVNVVNK